MSVPGRGPWSQRRRSPWLDIGPGDPERTVWPLWAWASNRCKLRGCKVAFFKPLIGANLLHSQNQAEKSAQLPRPGIPHGQRMTLSPGAASGAVKKHPGQQPWAPASGSEAPEPTPLLPCSAGAPALVVLFWPHGCESGERGTGKSPDSDRGRARGHSGGTCRACGQRSDCGAFKPVPNSLTPACSVVFSIGPLEPPGRLRNRGPSSSGLSGRSLSVCLPLSLSLAFIHVRSPHPPDQRPRIKTA